MSGESFDDFLEGDLGDLKPTKPFQFINHKKKEEVLDWMNQEWDNRKKEAQSRFRTYRENMALYKGIHYRSQETRGQDFRRDAGDRNLRTPKVVVNFVQEMTDSKVARLTRFKPGISILPNNDEYGDKVNSKIAKLFLDNRWNETGVENHRSEHLKTGFVYGESYLFAEWNPELGEVHPVHKEFVDRGEKIPKMDDEGNVIPDKFIDQPVHVGDVEYRTLGPDRVFPQLNKDSWGDVNEVMIIEYMHIEEAKKRFPQHADEFTASKEFRYSAEEMQEKKLVEEILIMKLYHKATKWLPKGRLVMATEDVLISNEDLPYDHGELPLVRFRDIEVPGELYGRSFIMNIRQLQRHYNNLASAVARNHGIMSAPKWMMPAGSCSVSNLNNDITIVEYKGGIAPQVVQSAPTAPEIFGYQDKLENLIGKQSNVTGISRGEPPKGIKAAVALQFLDEQEQERESRQVAKINENMRDLARLTLMLMHQFYRKEDGRTVKIIGKDNDYMLKSFSQAEFKFNYDVRIQNSSALPDSKAARIQSIIELNLSSQAEPVFSREQIIQMLDLGTDNVFKDQATVSVKAAESIVDSIINGDEVPEPQPYDDLLVHYRIYMTKLQERSFKEQLPSEIQAQLIQRIKTLEGLMHIRSQKNPVFKMKLDMIDSFPVFFELDPMLDAPPPMPMEGAPQSPNQPMDMKQINPQTLTGEQPMQGEGLQ